MKQSELIKQISDEDLRRSVLLSQFIFFALALLLSVFLFDSILDWQHYFKWDLGEILIYGVVPGIVIVVIDLILISILPASSFNDGGINERIFRNQTVKNIFIISFVVAFAEEMLFRGILQTTFGYVIASLIFAIVHVRYLKKPVLFFSVIFVSLLIGYIFLVTENLVVTITLHFLVDFSLGLYIRFKAER